MYRIILADDEPSIREGMRDLIDWKQLGYEIIGVFDDGAPVLSYLETHTVDVIVTDIKMTHQSGLDIAKYIYEHELHTRIIFISGYKELDLAMTAIKYNVCEYILKPIDIQELESQLISIKKQLDKERQNRANDFSLEFYQNSIMELKDEFFSELATGSLTNESYLSNMFHLMYPNLDLYSCPCCHIILEMDRYDEFIEHHWKHTASELSRCLENCIKICSSNVEFFVIGQTRNMLQLFGLATKTAEGASGNSTYQLFDKEIHNLCRELEETFYLRISLSKLDVYHHIIHYSHKCITSVSTDDPSFLLNLHEQEKLLFSEFRTGNRARSAEVLDALIICFSKLDFSLAQELVSEMLIIFRTQLLKTGYGDLSELLSQEMEIQIQQAKNFQEITSILHNLLNHLGDVEKQSQHTEDTLIDNIKAYIQEHITDDISLESISANFYLSKYYFSRIFKAATGENLIDYIIFQKIQKAKQLLLNPRLKIYEIGKLIGYNNTHYFIKVFKKHTGYTPSEFRSSINFTQKGD